MKDQGGVQPVTPGGGGTPLTAYRHPGTWSSPCLSPGVPLATGRGVFRSGAAAGGFSVCFLHIERCGSRPVPIERQSFPAFWMSSCTASVPHSLQLIVFGGLFSGRDHGPQLVIGQLGQVHAGHRSVGQSDIDCLSGVLADGVADRAEGLGVTS